MIQIIFLWFWAKKLSLSLSVCLCLSVSLYLSLSLLCARARSLQVFRIQRALLGWKNLSLSVSLSLCLSLSPSPDIWWAFCRNWMWVEIRENSSKNGGFLCGFWNEWDCLVDCFLHKREDPRGSSSLCTDTSTPLLPGCRPPWRRADVPSSLIGLSGCSVLFCFRQPDTPGDNAPGEIKTLFFSWLWYTYALQQYNFSKSLQWSKFSVAIPFPDVIIDF